MCVMMCLLYILATRIVIIHDIHVYGIWYVYMLHIHAAYLH